MASNSTPNLKAIPIVPYTIPKPDPSFDPIFFTKASVKVGTCIKYYGRRNPGSIWVVQTIYTFRSEKFGRVRSWIADVRTLDDILEMRNDKTGEIKQASFKYISDSARWRIETDHE